MFNRKALALFLALFSAPVFAQQQNPGVQQSGTVATNDCVKWGPGVGQIQSNGGPCAGGAVTPAALTAANDTNVTLTLSGTPATALLQAVTAQIGWSGTLAAGRLNANVVQGFGASDVSGSITAQVATLTLGAFTGDVTKTGGSLATVVAKFSGNVLPTGAGADSQIIVGSGVSNFVFSTVPNCPGGVIQYTAATHLFNCGSFPTSNMPSAVVSGASTTLTSGQCGSNVQRSNAGAVMTDTLPGTGTAVLPANCVVTVSNGDASALLAISAASGTSIKGTALLFNGFIYIGPGQALQFQSDGANYWPVGAPARAKLAAATTIFVATTGNDSTANGIASGSPYLGVTRAWTFAQSVLDLNGFGLTIQVADGTYTAAMVMNGPLVGQKGSFAQGSIYAATLQGNTVTPANVLVSVTGNSFGAIQAFDGASVLITGFKTVTASGGNGIYVEHATAAISLINCGNTTINCATATRLGYLQVVGAMTYSGINGCALLQSNAWISYETTATQTLAGGPVFSSGFVCSQYPGSIIVDAIPVFSGATGASSPRYNAFLNGLINTGGQGATFFPGTVAGSVATGGLYN